MEDLLVLDPDDRISAEDALRSTWLNRRFAATTRAPLGEEETAARLAMLKYAGYTKLKKMVRIGRHFKWGKDRMFVSTFVFVSIS